MITGCATPITTTFGSAASSAHLALLQGEEAAKQFLARIEARVEAARLD